MNGRLVMLWQKEDLSKLVLCSGFCLVNDLAVTAASLLQLGLVQKVMVVDLDVHQGDGTALIFKALIYQATIYHVQCSCV